MISLIPAVVFYAGSLLVASEEYARPELLIEPTELARPAVASQVVILDARSQNEHQREHVPGARWVDHDTWAKAFGDGENRDEWSQRIGELGIRADSRVVVYDDVAMKNAARIWWILRYWGVDDVRLLNGGWKSWKAKGLPTTSGKPEPVEPVVFQAEPRTERLATKDQVLQMLGGTPLQIVDARTEAEYCGTEALRNKRAGAIPGAKHLEWSDLVDQDTHRIKGPEELRHLFDTADIDLSKPVASHCQSGGRASVIVFGLELMGAKDVRNYYRGWSEWGNTDDTPIEPGKKLDEP